MTPTNTAAITDWGKDPRLIPQEKTNLEMPLALADSFHTPTPEFFVRSNGPTLAVVIDPETWRLRIHGCVNQELSLALVDLQAMAPGTMTAFLECSGNSRSRFAGHGSPVEGTNWGEGAVGNATWTGVPLRDVLNQAGIKPGAIDVVATGGDFDSMQRALPVDVATNGDVMLVWEMNGAPLLPIHGGPVRLIVPGWGAIASTKWVVDLNVINHRFDGYWNADNYVLYDESGAAIGPVTRMPVKSVITTPGENARIPAGSVAIEGFAWSGHGGIDRVEISTDDGAHWEAARIIKEAGPLAWVQFAFTWSASPGDHILQSRAVDREGNVQPTQARWNRKGYQMNAIRSARVVVT